MLTVATLNINNYENQWLERRELIVSEFVDLQPDIVALQEVRISAGQGWWICNQLNERLREPVYTLVQQRRMKLLFGRTDGVGILTRLPVISQDAISLGYDGRVALRANVGLPNGYTVDVVTTHLHPPKLQPEAREEQMMKLIGWLNERGGALHQIIAGDLNEVPSGSAIRFTKQQYLSAYEAVYGRDPIATWPTAMIRSEGDWAGCLDYIFVSSTFEVKAAQLIGTQHHPDYDQIYPSDHVGLIATLKLRAIG